MAETSAPVFILGCERSGSTWLANILDAHADVELWMEPFADYAGLFAGFPHRNEYLRESQSDLVEGVRAGWTQLHRHKYPLLYRPGLPLYRKAIDRRFFSSWWKLRRLLGMGATSAIDRYVLLNLSSSTLPCSRQTRKRSEPATQVVKELRLNFKVELLAKAFPDARYLVPIRHPGAQIASILRWFSRGSLRELSDSLPTFIRTIGDHPRFEKYRESLEMSKPGADKRSTLVLWWFINYEVLLEDLARHGLEHHLVPHEEISADPAAVTDRLLSACGLEVDNGVREFLSYSTSDRTRMSSPVDTVRDSSVFYRRAISEADPAIVAGVRELADQQDRTGRLFPRFGEYIAGITERFPSATGVD